MSVTTPYPRGTLPLTSEVVLVTPEYARTLRTTCHFERQRAINADQVKRLASEMSHGWFLAGTPIWLCVLPDRSMLIVNGNHTLEAVASLDFAVPLTIVYQQVTDINEASLAYACFDINRTRTWLQAAQAIGLDDKIPLVQAVLPALSLISLNFVENKAATNITQSRRLRFDAAADYTSAAHLLHVAFHGGARSILALLRRAPVFAVALATSRYQPGVAEEFWHGIAADDGLKTTDPRKALLRYLANNAVRTSIYRMEQAKGAALAWNAFFKKQELTLIKPNQMKEFYLFGTPWHNGTSAPEPKPSAKRPSGEEVGKSMVKTGTQTSADGKVTPVVVYAP
jgi:hypothetical protein